MSEDNAVASRVMELELLVTHLQNELQQLSSVVLQQQTEFEQLRQQLHRVEQAFADSTDGGEDRDPMSERPPHY